MFAFVYLIISCHFHITEWRGSKKFANVYQKYWNIFRALNTKNDTEYSVSINTMDKPKWTLNKKAIPKNSEGKFSSVFQYLF